MKGSNIFLNKYFSECNSIHSKTIKISRVSDNIVNLNPTPLYINPIVAHYEKINNGVKDIINNLDKNINISNYNDDETKHLHFFTTQGARTTDTPIMDYDKDCITTITQYIREGITEILKNVYNYSDSFEMKIRQSNIHSYSNGTFISPHTHLIINNNFINNSTLFLSAAYYVDDGDPDDDKTHSGCITFISNERPYHIKPLSGTLLLWESNLLHCVNPFYSKSNRERIVITINLYVKLSNFI